MALEIERIGTMRHDQPMGLLAKTHLLTHDDELGTGWIVDPLFQRGSVWSLEQKQAWIESLLMGIGLPAIIVNRFPLNEEHPVYGFKEIVIDGQQRLRATAGFLRDEFKVRGEYFSQQDDVFRRVFVYSTGLCCVVYCNYKTDRECAELYLKLLRAGTAHTELEIAKAENYIKARPS
jgi:hypothetical protein